MQDSDLIKIDIVFFGCYIKQINSLVVVGICGDHSYKRPVSKTKRQLRVAALRRRAPKTS